MIWLETPTTAFEQCTPTATSTATMQLPTTSLCTEQSCPFYALMISKPNVCFSAEKNWHQHWSFLPSTRSDNRCTSAPCPQHCIAHSIFTFSTTHNLSDSPYSSPSSSPFEPDLYSLTLKSTSSLMPPPLYIFASVMFVYINKGFTASPRTLNFVKNVGYIRVALYFYMEIIR